jgi:hypothetical protein
MQTMRLYLNYRLISAINSRDVAYPYFKDNIDFNYNPVKGTSLIILFTNITELIFLHKSRPKN